MAAVERERGGGRDLVEAGSLWRAFVCFCTKQIDDAVAPRTREHAGDCFTRPDLNFSRNEDSAHG